jgi:hypothetical protein
LAMVLFPAPAGPSMATTMRFCIVSAKKQDNKRRTGGRESRVGGDSVPPCRDAARCRFESYLGSHEDGPLRLLELREEPQFGFELDDLCH